MSVTKEEAIRQALATETFVQRTLIDEPLPSMNELTVRRLRREYPAVLLFSDDTPYMFFRSDDAAKCASDIMNSRGRHRVHYARTKDMSDSALLAALG